jgi:hypothetical protein
MEFSIYPEGKLMPDPNSVIGQLWHPDEQSELPQIYAILDAARNEKIYPAIIKFDGEFCCLFGEDIPRTLAKASPYLVKLEPENAFTKWLFAEGWGDSWGIFLQSDASLEELGQHFRKLIKVRDEAGKEIFFRYYDPRILRVYLPTCNEMEIEEFSGPVQSFLLEEEKTDKLLRYSRDSNGIACETIALI